MPFDGTFNPVVQRSRLIQALREEMPAGFTWDFAHTLNINDCGTAGCAMGLAQKIGLISRDDVWKDNEVCRTFGLSYRQFENIFMGDRNFYSSKDFAEVTSVMVADALAALGDENRA